MKNISKFLAITLMIMVLIPDSVWTKITGWDESEMEDLFDALDPTQTGSGVESQTWFVRASALTLNKLDATAAPDADNDVDEGYAVGSVWIDVTNDEYYICVDATDGAAVWSQGGTGTGSGTSISQGDTGWWATDTGTDGKLEGKADGTTFIEITKDGIAQGITAIDTSLTTHLAYDPGGSPSTWNAGETVDICDVVYYDATDGEMKLADANVTTKYPAFGIVLGATTGGDSEAADGEPILVMREGILVNTGWSWSTDADICLSETGTTGNTLIDCDDASIFSAEDDAKQIIGQAITGTKIYFNFNMPHIVKGP